MLHEAPYNVHTGVDVVPWSRVERSLDCFGESYLKRMLTGGEISECAGSRKIQKIAARIAAKEAVMKILGTGWPRVSWTDIEVRKCSNGKPEVVLHGKAGSVAEDLGIVSLAVSLTHDAGVSIAVAVCLARRG